MCMCVYPVCVYVHMLMFMYVYCRMFVFVYMLICTCVYIQCTHTFINMHICVQFQECMRICIHVYIMCAYGYILCVHKYHVWCACMHISILCMHISIYLLPTWCSGRLLCVCTCVCPLALLPRRGLCLCDTVTYLLLRHGSGNTPTGNPIPSHP